MGSLIGLKNLLIFSAVLLAIGSVSAQQAFAAENGPLACFSSGDGNWNDASKWTFCNDGTPNANKNATIDGNIIITGNEEALILDIRESASLFIDCDASLKLFSAGVVSEKSIITNHGILESVPSLTITGLGTFLFNSGDHSGVVTANDGAIVEISTICTQPIGGTVGSMDTASLLVAGAQANMGLWSLALVGAVVAGAAITYKLKSKKTEQ